jgi:hypothetical protein
MENVGKTGNTGQTRHRTKINVRKYRKGNRNGKCRENWQHRADKTQDENKR